VRSILFIAIPAAMGLLVLSRPIIQLVFQRGQFTEESTLLVATALGAYALGLIGHSGVEILVRAFYALHDTKTPVLLGIVSLVINLIISLSLINVLGITGLALANTIAALLEMSLLIVMIRKRLGGLDDQRLTLSALKTTIAAMVMGLAVLGFLSIAATNGVIVRTFGGIAIGAGVFALAAWLLRVEELRSITELIRRKVLGRG
jgi:putative peptidoglycan lipid II flippase